MRRGLALLAVIAIVFVTYRWAMPAALGWPVVQCGTPDAQEVVPPGPVEADACEAAWRSQIAMGLDYGPLVERVASSVFWTLFPVSAVRVEGFGAQVHYVEISVFPWGRWVSAQWD